jgi:hypothetical protein
MKKVLSLAVLLTIVGSLIILKADCPPDIEEWDCRGWTTSIYDCAPLDPDNYPLCKIHFKYCVSMAVNQNTGEIPRRVYIDEWKYDEYSGDCSCIDAEIQILKTIFHIERASFGIETAGNYGFEVYSSPCWIYSLFIGESCEEEVCCLTKYSVSYNDIFIPNENRVIWYIDDVVFVSHSNPVISCEPGCESYCDRFAISYERWDDYCPSSPGDFTGLTIPPKIVQIQKDRNEGFYIFPNPGSGFIQVLISNIEDNGLCISLFDVNGSSVHEIDSYTLSDDIINIEIANIPNGLYYLRITNDKDIYIKKILIVN